jgi:prophage maintenance system killer protein
MTGERHFLRDPGLLESAVARPQNAFAYGEEDIVALAVDCSLVLLSRMLSSRVISERLLLRWLNF